MIMDTAGHGSPRIINYTRHSSDEQNHRSCIAQANSNERKVKEEGFSTEGLIHLSDEGISGERLFRPGIDEVRRLVKERKCDIVVAEDVSGFFRNDAEPFKLAGQRLAKRATRRARTGCEPATFGFLAQHGLQQQTSSTRDIMEPIDHNIRERRAVDSGGHSLH